MSVATRASVFVAVLGGLAAFGACAEIKSGDPSVGTASDAGAADATKKPTKFEVVHSLGDGSELTSVWGFDDDTIFAVGNNGLRYLSTYGRFIRSNISPGRDYSQVWGLSRNDVYAVGVVGKKGFVEHWDGEKWNEEYIAETPLFSVWGDGKVVMAVGPGGRIYGREAKAGGEWAQRGGLKEPEVPNFVAVTGNGSSNLTLVDEKRIYHTNNYGDFPWFEPATGQSVRFMSAWGAPGNETNVFVGMNHLSIAWMFSPGLIGSGGEFDAGSMLEPGKGLENIELALLTKDERDPDSDDLFIRGIHGEGNQRYFVGDRGRMYAFDILTTDTKTIETGTEDPLFGVWASKDSVWVVGAHELVLRAPRASLSE